MHEITPWSQCHGGCGDRPAYSHIWAACCTETGRLLATAVTLRYRTIFLLGHLRDQDEATRPPNFLSLSELGRFAAWLSVSKGVEVVSLDGSRNPVAHMLRGHSLGSVKSLSVPILAVLGLTAGGVVRCCDVDRISEIESREIYLERYDGRLPVVITGSISSWRAFRVWETAFFQQEPYGSHVIEVLRISRTTQHPLGSEDLFRRFHPVNMTLSQWAEIVKDPKAYGFYMFLDNSLFSVFPGLAAQ